LQVDIIEQHAKTSQNKKAQIDFRTIPVRVTAGTTSDLLAGKLLPGEQPSVQICEFITDASRKDSSWRPKPEMVMPRKTDVLRCEIIYEDKDSRCFFRGETQVNQRNGIGVLSFKDGVIYHGQFAQDLPNGLAVETYPDGFGD
jgi:hypothetical protein